MGLVFLIGVIALYNLSDFITPDNKGTYRLLEQSIQALIVLIGGWVVARLLNALMWDSYAERHGRQAPDLLKTATNFVAIAVALVFIVTNIYGQSYVGVLAALGFLGIGAGLGLQSLILDAFAGIILQMENSLGGGQWLGVGDWVQLEGQDEPTQVTNMTWRYTMFRTEDNHSVLVPNGALTQKILRNYSRPYGGFTAHIEITLDHDVPVSRGAAVLYEAASKAQGVLDTAPVQVNVMGSNAGGIVYEVEFVIADYDDMKPTRHRVYESITRSLHEKGLRLSETLGVWFDEVMPLEMKTPPDSLDILAKNALFSSLTKEDLRTLAKHAKRHMTDLDTILCRQGEQADSLFIVGEGMVRIYREEKDEATGEMIEVPLAQLFSGSYFGEMALLTGQPRSAFVSTMNQAFLIEIRKSDLLPIMQKEPKLAETIALAVMQRKKGLDANVADLHKHRKALQEESQKLANQIKEFFGFSS